MNNNYIVNNFHNKYDLTSYFQKKEKSKNFYSITYDENDLNKDNINKNQIIKNNYILSSNLNPSYKKYKIIRTSSFFLKTQRKNKNYLNKLNDINYINEKIINFFIKIINTFKNLLLKQKRKEQLLFKEIMEKNTEIKNIKKSFLKMIYFFKKEINKDDLKEFFFQKILIEKQLVTENNYLRNLILSKTNLYPNFYSSYEASYDGLIDIMEKGFMNNNLKSSNKNYKKHDTANNSPQLSNQDDFSKEGLLFINKKNKIFRNYYLLKKNRKKFFEEI